MHMIEAIHSYWVRCSVRTRALVVVAALGAVTFVLVGHGASNRLPEGRISARATHFEERIRAVGPKAAFAELTASVRGMSVNDQHGAAHDFGKALYFVDGLTGDDIQLCGMNFTAGCLHELFSEAVADRGLQTAGQLAQVCLSTFSSLHDKAECEHAVGHAVVSLYGYSLPSLQNALGVCATIPTSDKNSGCLTGAFMEYNERFFLGPDGREREFHSFDPYDPFDQIPEPYRGTCLYWQANWWRKVLPDANTTERFRKIGAYCADLEESPRVKKMCYEGIGYAAMWEGFSATTTAALCDAGATDSPSKQACYDIGAFSMGLHVSTSTARLVCNSLTGASKTECLTYAAREPVLNGMQ